eukprot:9714459-Heterocapsa_arctica.AAC.1
MERRSGMQAPATTTRAGCKLGDRAAKTNGTYSSSRRLGIEAYCDYDSKDGSPKLYQFPDTNNCVEKGYFKLGLKLGNQHHRADLQKKSQEKTQVGDTHQGDTREVRRARKKI